MMNYNQIAGPRFSLDGGLLENQESPWRQPRVAATCCRP